VRFFSVRGDLDVVGFCPEVGFLTEVIGLIAECLCAGKNLLTVVGTFTSAGSRRRIIVR
jgi:hypothetical protein